MKRMIFLLIAVSFTLVGCWDSTETEQLGVVTLMGVGLNSNKDIRVIIQEKPHEKQTAGAGGESKIPFLVYEESGSTITDALQKMATNEHHRLYFAHTNVIILDEALLSSMGIKPVMDFCERNPQVRLSTWVLIAPKGQLDKMLNTDVKLNIDTGTILEETINNQETNSFFTVANISEVVEMLYKSGSELYSASISIKPKSSSGGTENSSGSTNKKFSIQDTAVFKGEKMVGWLNNREHRGLAWIAGTAKGGIMTIPVESGMLSVRIVRMKSKVEPEISNKKMLVNIKVEIESNNILESQAGLNFLDEATIKKVEQAQQEEVKKDITAALNKSRELESDIFGFGNYFFMKYPKLWREIKDDWYSYYPDIEVSIDVKTTIKNIGKIYKPINK